MGNNKNIYKEARQALTDEMSKYTQYMCSPLTDLELGSFMKNPEEWTYEMCAKVNSLKPDVRATYLCPLVLDAPGAKAASDSIAKDHGLPAFGEFDKDAAADWVRTSNEWMLAEHGSLRTMLDIAGDPGQDRQEFLQWLNPHIPTAGMRAFAASFVSLRDPYKGKPGIPVLTEEQMNSVSPLKPGWQRIIAAVPGSGKTFSLVSLVENGIYRWKYKPNEITVISFTTTAANEFRARFTDRNRNLGTRLPRICTADSLALRIVRQYAPQTLPKEMQNPVAWKNGMATRHILMGDEKEKQLWDTVVNNLMKRLSIPENRKTLLLDNLPQAIVQCRSNLWSKDEVDTSVGSFSLSEQEIREAAAEYQKEKERQGLVDFIDIREKAIKTLETNHKAKAQMQAKCKMLVVDEYQDTNLLQKALEKQLVPYFGIKIMAGDDDQGIYGHGMGGRAEMMQETQNEPNTETVYLTYTRRFKWKSLVSMFRTFISNSGLNRINKKYNVPNNTGEGEKPLMVMCPRSKESKEEGTTRWDDEIRVNLSILASQIEKAPETDPEGRRKIASECAILCRTREQVARINEMLRTMPEYRMLARYANNRTQTLKESISNTSPQVMKAKALLDSMEKPYSKEDFSSMLLTVGEGMLTVPWSTKASEHGLPAWIDTQTEQLMESYGKWVDSINDMHVDEDRFIEAYKAAADTPKAGDAVMTFFEKMKIEPDDNLKAFALALNDGTVPVNEWSEYRDSLLAGAGQTPTGRRNGFTIMTEHKSKGLEWGHVQVMGQGEDDDLANRQRDMPPSIIKKLDNEEKRVIYVGMTRSKENLVITGGNNSGRFVERLGVIGNFVEKSKAVAVERMAKDDPIPCEIGRDGHLLPPTARYDIFTDSFNVRTFESGDRRRIAPQKDDEASKEKVRKKANSLTGKPIKIGRTLTD